MRIRWLFFAAIGASAGLLCAQDTPEPVIGFVRTEAGFEVKPTASRQIPWHPLCRAARRRSAMETARASTAVVGDP
jgi:hypothetical protein